MHTFTIYALIFNTLNIAIKTPNSWSFHIIRIYTSKCIVKNSRNKVTIHFISSYYDTTKNSHNDMNIEFIAKVYVYLHY